MPKVVNPAQGYLVNWNNKPEANWSNSVRGFGQWGPVARVRTLMNLVGALPPGSVGRETVAQINTLAGHTTDTPSGNAGTVVVSSLLGAMLANVDVDADERLPAVVGMLGKWNMLQVDRDVDGNFDHPAVAIFNTWWPSLIDRVFADELGTRMERNVVANLAGRMLVPGLVPLQHDYLDGESVVEAVTGALISALDSMTATYGSDMTAWLHPDPMISWDAIGAAQVPDTPYQNRGTYFQISRLGRGAGLKAQNAVAPGQSGNPFSPHFADQLVNYATWDDKKMRLTKNSLAGHTESKIRVKVRK
jgi:acyl-homoserine lactone acylase PvdQ